MTAIYVVDLLLRFVSIIVYWSLTSYYLIDQLVLFVYICLFACFPQGEVGAPGSKGEPGAKGEGVSSHSQHLYEHMNVKTFSFLCCLCV